MCLFFISLGLILVRNGDTFAQQITISDAISKMERNNPALLSAEKEIQIKEEEKKSAKGLRYPKGELEVKQTFLDSPIDIGVDPLPFTYEVQEKQFTKGQIKVSLPIYAGGRIDSANEIAQHRKTEAVYQKEWTYNQLVTELAQRYYGLVLAKQNYEVQKIKTRLMKQHADRAEKLFREGIIAKVELLHAQVELSKAEQEESTALSDVSIVLEGLNNILFESGLWEPTSKLFILSEEPALDVFKATVNDSHPGVGIVNAKIKQAEVGVKAEKGVNKPTIYLFGMHEIFKDDLTLLDPTWAVGIGMNYTFFDGFQTKHKVLAGKALVEKAEVTKLKIQKDLESLVVKRYEEMKKARDQWSSYQKTLELTEENLRVRKKAFEEGVTTSLEVVDAIYQHSRAQLGLLKSAFDYDLAFFQLLEASGQTRRWEEYLKNSIPIEFQELKLEEIIH
ncbi:MAG: TolC family protein [Candidatus Hydrogenedentes bacterium]|nr:TolC family protein [Candidatus Hydrogenedentota bacterium]